MWFKQFIIRHQSLTVSIILFLLMLLTFYLRLSFISDYKFIFRFDQARDALAVREIWLDHNLKLHGPTASGTNDTVFHGVFYYYFLAPWYLISQGDPQLPLTMLMLWTVVIGIPAVYLLAFSVSKSKVVGLLTAGLVAFSAQNIGYSVFLTNPTLGYPFLPVFFLALWKIFFDRSLQSRYIFLLALSLGVLIQSVLWYAPLILVIVGALYYSYSQDKSFVRKLFTPKFILLFVCTLGLFLLPMVIVQIRMFVVGIFTWSGLQQASAAHQISDLSSVIAFIDLYLRKIIESFFPTQALFMIFLLPFFYLSRKALSQNQKVFGLLLLLIPISIGLVQPRANWHFFLGLEIVLYMYLSLILVKLSFPFKWMLVSLLVVLIFFSNHKQLQYLNDNHSAIFEYPLSRSFKTTLQDSLLLVDETYRLAEGKPFSISSLASPYKYNTVFAYLYDWYGRSKYGYVPSFYGDTQVGLINEGLLPETEQPLSYHFSIIQGDNTLGQNYIDDFNSIQSRAAGVPLEQMILGKNVLNVHPINRSQTQ